MDVFNLAYIRHSVEMEIESSAARSRAARMAENDASRQRRLSSRSRQQIQATSAKNGDENLTDDVNEHFSFRLLNNFEISFS